MIICPICLDKIYIFYYKCKCNCKAQYHLDCINTWFEKKQYCPICKKPDLTNTNKFINKIYKFYEACLIFLILILLLTFNLIYNILLT